MNTTLTEEIATTIAGTLTINTPKIDWLSFALNKVNELIITKPKFKSLKTPSPTNDIIIKAVDIHDNYTSIIIIRNSLHYIGYAKCNPNCDHTDTERGVTIACSNALGRLKNMDPIKFSN